MYRIEHYLTTDEQKDVYDDWLRRLRDAQAKVAINEGGLDRLLEVLR